MTLQRPTVHAPEFPPAVWVNTPTPLTMAGLRGRVVLIDIWDFTCVNCLRTLPYLRAWYERYNDLGLEIVGVHTPEFSFARDREWVEAAVGRLGIRWPVVLDNDQAIWTAYANRYWPTVYLIDAQGYVRYRHIGEGGYAQTERAIQALLQEQHPDWTPPEPVPPVRPEDAPDAVCYPTTPELHIDSIGNPQRPLDVPLLFLAPPVRSEGAFYLQGLWRAAGDGLTLAGEEGEILLPYQAASVNAVLSPSPDPVTLALHLTEPLHVELTLDAQPLPPEAYGEDVYRHEQRARVLVDSPRMYQLVRHPDLERHELGLRVRGRGFTFYAFSFGSCVAPDAETALSRQE